MPWENSPEKRARDAKTYGDPEYKRNRLLAIRRAGGKCEEMLDSGHRCGSQSRVQVDHIIPVTHDGTHHLDNLRVLCKRCHDKKTAQEGGGYRKNGGRRNRREADPVLTARTKW